MTYSEEDLKLESYDYELPEELIATRPAAGRINSKLLVFDEASDNVRTSQFFDLLNELPAETTLVLNQSKVFPCRLFGKKSTGAKVEVFILGLEAEELGYKVLIRSSSKKRIGDIINFSSEISCEITSISDGTFHIKFQGELKAQEVVAELGSVPLPPYIRGGISDEADLTDYQTVYAKELGSVAAPTAGLHFTPELIGQLKQKGIEVAYVTLHVGLGTFLPVKTERIEEHKMHSEKYHISGENLKKIKRAKKIVAVGTTSLRVLESMPENLVPEQEYTTDIFLHPGREVKSIDGLITNFHLPESSLIILVSALIGREKTMELYRYAIKNSFRFFSYGDSMFIKRKGRWS